MKALRVGLTLDRFSWVAFVEMNGFVGYCLLVFPQHIGKQPRKNPDSYKSYTIILGSSPGAGQEQPINHGQS